MTQPRRSFLKTGLIGAIGACSIPISFSFFNQYYSNDPLRSLFDMMGFEKFNVHELALPINGLDDSDASNIIIKNKEAYGCGDVVCIQETFEYDHGVTDQVLGIYQKIGNAFTKVIKLNAFEVNSLYEVASHIVKEHDKCDSQLLRDWLMPVSRNKRHESWVKEVYPSGYYTENGYCAMKITPTVQSCQVKVSILDYYKQPQLELAFELSPYLLRTT